MSPSAERGAVLFDVGNTLLYPFPSVSHVCAEILAQAGHERELASIEELMPVVDAYYEDRYQADDTFWTDEGATSDVWVGMYSLLCRRLGIDDDAERLAMAVYDAFGSPERWRAWDDVPAAFERLREAGYRLAVLSNWDARLGTILDGLGLRAMLDAVVSSAEVGLHKPDPRIFELACDMLGVEPARATHVGDHPYADVLGATTAGLDAILIDRHGTAPEVSVPVIRSLDELDAHLTR